MAVLVVAAHDGKTVRANVANAVAAAAQMDPEVHVLVAGSNAGEAAKSAAASDGAALLRPLRVFPYLLLVPGAPSSAWLRVARSRIQSRIES